MLTRQICPSTLLQWRDWEFAMGGSPNCALLGSWTRQKCEKEAEINASSCSHRQVFFSLLYNHPSALAPYITAKLQACSSARSQAWLLLFPSPCTSILLSWCPSQPLLPSFSTCFSLTSDFQPSSQCRHCNVSTHRTEWCRGRRKQLGTPLHLLFQPYLFTLYHLQCLWQAITLQHKKHFQVRAALHSWIC